MNLSFTIIIKRLLLWLFLINGSAVFGQLNTYHAVYSGVPWFDNNGAVVSAHGANIIIDNGKYYLFGERHSDTSNAFAGFNCYSSTNLYSWTFERIALPLQTNGKLGANRVGERPKVMKCPTTGEYIMYMHVDSINYKDQFVGYATAKTITGPYLFQGPLLLNDKPIKKWDMGTFQDNDGTGYVLMHGGDIYKLNADYKSVMEQVCKAFTPEFEAPSLFRKDSVYYFLGSHLSSWEKNDNYYFTSTSLKGPWTARGIFAPEGTLTWYSQATFVLPIVGSKNTTYMFMGDRWSFPKQFTAATYVWQPLTISGTSVSIPTYAEAWTINTATGITTPATIGKKTIQHNNQQAVVFNGNWRNDTLSLKSSDEKGSSFSVKFSGQQIGFYGLARPDGGYASITLKNSKGETVLSSMVDTYRKYSAKSLLFLSPLLAKDVYTFSVTVAGEKGNWSDKRKSNYGSTGYVVSLDKIVVQ